MVSMAPEFGDIAGALSQRMQNRILVALNIQFESRMLFNEFSRVKANFDPGGGICTLPSYQRETSCCMRLTRDFQANAPPCAV